MDVCLSVYLSEDREVHKVGEHKKNDNKLLPNFENPHNDIQKKSLQIGLYLFFSHVQV